LKEISSRGLKKVNFEERDLRMIMLKDLFEKMATSWSDPLTFKLAQIPELTVFQWLC